MAHSRFEALDRYFGTGGTHVLQALIRQDTSKLESDFATQFMPYKPLQEYYGFSLFYWHLVRNEKTFERLQPIIEFCLKHFPDENPKALSYENYLKQFHYAERELLETIYTAPNTDFTKINQSFSVSLDFFERHRLGVKESTVDIALYQYQKKPKLQFFCLEETTTRTTNDTISRSVTHNFYTKSLKEFYQIENIAFLMYEDRALAKKMFEQSKASAVQKFIENVKHDTGFAFKILKPFLEKHGHNTFLTTLVLLLFPVKYKSWKSYLKHLYKINITNSQEFFCYGLQKTKATITETLPQRHKNHIKTYEGKAIDKEYLKSIQQENQSQLNYFKEICKSKNLTPEGYLDHIFDNNMELIFKIGGQPKNIFIRKLLNIFLPQPLLPKGAVKSHTYVTGQSGSGKSEFLKTFMLYLNSLGHPFILIDPHGDLADSLEGVGQPHTKNPFFSEPLFYPCHTIAPLKARYVVNPFDIDDKSPNNRELVAQEISQMLKEMINDVGLSALMDTISFPIIYTLLKLPYADFSMFADCIRPNAGIEKLQSLTPLVEPHQKGIWEELCGESYDTTKRSVYNRLQGFLNKRLIGAMVTGRDDLKNTLESVIERRENIIISLPIPTLGEQVSQVLGRFFMTRLQIWAKHREAIPEPERFPVFLCVDEVQNFLSQETARTLDQFGRKYGLLMVLANQHIRQIEDTQLKGSILSNCKNKVVGMSDKTTRQTLAGEMGLTPDVYETLRAGQFWGKFDKEPAFRFASRMVKPSRESSRLLTSQNGEDSPDGWEQVPTRTKTQNQESPKPKFEI